MEWQGSNLSDGDALELGVVGHAPKEKF